MSLLQQDGFTYSYPFLAMLWVGRASAFASSIGSLAIIIDIGGTEWSVLNQILFLMSVFDIVCSVGGFGLGTIMVPEGYAWGSAGNVVTCEIQAYLLMSCGGTVAFYNTVLALYFVLSVRFNWKDNAFRRMYLVWFCFVVLPPAFMLSFNAWPLHLKAFDYDYTTSTCGWSLRHTSDAYTIQLALACLAIFFTIVIISCMVILYLYTHNTERASNQYAFSPSGQYSFSQSVVAPSSTAVGGGEGNDGSEEGNNIRSNRNCRRSSISTNFQNNNNYSRSTAVAYNGILYSGCFIATYFFWYVSAFMDFGGVLQPYWVLLLVHLFLPLQGFLNAFVYFRRKFKFANCCCCCCRPKQQQQSTTRTTANTTK